MYIERMLKFYQIFEKIFDKLLTIENNMFIIVTAACKRALRADYILRKGEFQVDEKMGLSIYRRQCKHA